ncbi:MULTISPECIES: hypothetical protein [unclassified Providencia]|nr:MULTISPECIES: hypothetical protein [unclassified Providencia]MCK9791868.1 hypothetical protein [Providencia rettgeri]MDX7426124.1 hypothetical protein [Providencia sp. CIM-Carb-044]
MKDNQHMRQKMTGTNDSNYQPDELKAIASFDALGIFATLNKLTALSNVAQARLAECFAQNDSIPSGFTALDFLTPEEREEHHILRLSLAICVDEQSEAKKRVNARLKARHEEYKAKRGAV